MRVCIPTDSPGGPDALVADSFQASDLFDIYDLDENGDYVLSTQIRNCSGTCKDDIETIVRRGTEAVIVKEISANALQRLKASGVSVYLAADGPVSNSLTSFHRNDLAAARSSDRKTKG